MSDAREWLQERLNTPFAKSTKALVIVGPKGSGKTIAAQLIARELENGRAFFISGPEISRITEFRDIDKRYLAIVDEPTSRDLDVIKHLLTSSRIQVEPRGDDAFTTSFNVNFVLTSCSFDVSDTPSNRRFIVTSPMEVFAAVANMRKAFS